MDLNQFKQMQVETWELGDYRPVGEMLAPAATNLVRAVNVTKGSDVLDVGTGSGNVAIAAARASGHVVGIDITDAWFGEARSLAAEDGHQIELRLGDAEDLPFEDESFDFVLSSFAAIFAPRHQMVADELTRVCRRGGKIGLNTWTPEGKINRVTSSLMAHLPEPPEFADPSERWGLPDYVREIFPDTVELSFERPDIPVEFDSIDAFEDFALHNSGGFIRAHEALTTMGKWEQARGELRRALREVNQATDGSFKTSWDYLQVVGVKL